MKKLFAITFSVIAVMFLLGYVVAVRVLFPPPPEPEDGIAVPSLIGLSVSAAEDQLRPLGLRVVETTEIAHPTQPPGLIIAQTPLPGQQLRELGTVRLAISAGLPRTAVPDVVGFTAERASTMLSSMGFQVDQRTEESPQPAGTVLRVSPTVGSEVPMPARVLITVSSGPPAAPPPDTTPADTVSASGTTT